MLIDSIVLGIFQGISEFLPISSSAHLVVIPYIFNWQWQGLVFDVALHFGTLLAILVFFANDWRKILRIDKTEGDLPKSFFWMIIAGTIPGALAGVFFENLAATVFRTPILIATTLFVFGIIIYFIDRLAKRDINIKNITYKQALLVGLGQMLAIVPGVSRSGVTMAVGRLIGLKREAAARFSFYLAAPIMLGAALFELRHFSLEMLDFPFFSAFLLSFLFGLLAIKYLLEYLKKGSFAVFAWYRIVLAIVVVVIYLQR